jgi:ABC-type glycerol-3-phosphate transport system substrate-binding protein
MRPWEHARIKMFMENNPAITINYQWFPITDLGKKIKVGYATGTAPDGFKSGTWLMPTWIERNLVAPMDVQRLGWNSFKSFQADFSSACVEDFSREEKLYGYPMWYLGFSNFINTKHFKEVGLDPFKEEPQTWEELGEIASKLTVRDGQKFVRQGFKFSMHAPLWTVYEYNPILGQCGATWFNKDGTASFNSEGGIKAMTIRSSMAKKYKVEDPADSIATHPLPMLDFLKERCSMDLCHPIIPAAVKSQNPKMAEEGYYRALHMPGVTPANRGTTSYGLGLAINKQAPKDKQEILHDLYKFIMADLVSCWQATGPFPPARKGDWIEHPSVRNSRDLKEMLAAQNGYGLPRTPLYDELCDIMHRACQKVLLTNEDIKKTLDDAVAEYNRALSQYKMQK